MSPLGTSGVQLLELGHEYWLLFKLTNYSWRKKQRNYHHHPDGCLNWSDNKNKIFIELKLRISSRIIFHLRSNIKRSTQFLMGGLLKSLAAPRFLSICLPRNGYRMKHYLSSVISDTWTWELFREENVYEYMTSRVCDIYLSTKVNTALSRLQRKKSLLNFC